MAELTPLVSIVIPAYNHASYLAAAINSVLAQDYPSIELIVIDDGSTDDTHAVLEKFKDEFYWETQTNAGQARTLEKGWNMARGQILGYLSADDLLEPKAVSESVKALLAHPDAVASYCDFNLIDPQSRIIRQVEVPDFSYRDMLVNVSCPLGPGAFFQSKAYAAAGPWSASYRQMPDYDFWLRLGLFGSFVHIPQVLAGFRVHEASQTYSQTTPERAAEPVQIIESILQHQSLSPEVKAQAHIARASAHLVSAQLDLRAGRIAAGIKGISTAFGHAPAMVLSVRSLRLLANAALNRVGHRLLWRLKSLRSNWGNS